MAVHGVGSGTNWNRAGFSRELSDHVSRVQRPVRRIEYGEEKPPRRPPCSIFWKEALWEGENDRIDKRVAAGLRLLSVKFPGAWLAAPLLDLLADVPLYCLTPQRRKIRKVVRDTIRMFPGCVVVAHSLGSVIVADILCQALRDGTLRRGDVSALVTIGSPLNILGLTKGAKMSGEFPFPWHDLYYPADRIHLKAPLDGKRFPGVDSRPLARDQGFVQAHTSYWGLSLIAKLVRRLSTGGAP
ncbi:MAG TPA: hypothetical protein P5567_03055 [Kiritimatiellia bacterium]|nr:hypothetical protein [Kiritimatiellia bacterium]HSA17037.1 hypothetical protein [Kiritimatiellia bacterium]